MFIYTFHSVVLSSDIQARNKTKILYYISQKCKKNIEMGKLHTNLTAVTHGLGKHYFDRC